MLFPVRCCTCNKYIGAKGEEYKHLLKKYRSKSEYKTEVLITAATTQNDIKRFKTKEGKTPECLAMDNLGITRYCCRTRFLTSIDLLNL